jgi:hypothetical protein
VASGALGQQKEVGVAAAISDDSSTSSLLHEDCSRMLRLDCSDEEMASDGRRSWSSLRLRLHPFLCELDIFSDFFQEKKRAAEPAGLLDAI